MREGLVGGEGFGVDASLIKADANRQKGIEGEKGLPPEATGRAVQEYLAVLDDAAFGAATEVTPKFISPADPAARWTGARGGQAFFAYSTNYLIDVDNAIRVRHQFSVRFPIGQTCRSAWGRHKAMAASRPRKILGPADSLSNPTSAIKSTFSEHKLRCIRQCLGSRREFDNLGGDFFLPQLTFPLGEADELRFDVRLR